MTSAAKPQSVPDHTWRDWIIANALGELIGLGGTAALGFALADRLAWLPFFLVMVAAGVLLEGAFVGVAQWWVLRHLFARIRWQSWTVATMIGAGTAWLLGMVPSTLMSLGDEAGTSTSPPADWMIYLFAFCMGLALGPVLGYAQWWVLRRHTPRALWWLPANALAWSVGMVVIFWGAGSLPTDASRVTLAFFGGSTLLLAGALVGALHGRILIWMAESSHMSNLPRGDLSSI